MSPAGANLSPEAAAPGKRRLLLRERSCRRVITAVASLGHSRKPGARVGVEAETGRGPPPFLFPSHNLLLPRSSRRPLDPMTLAVETSQVGPYQISQARTEASGGSSNDCLSSLSPKELSEVLSNPSTSGSFNFILFCCVLQYWKVQLMLGKYSATKLYSPASFYFLYKDRVLPHYSDLSLRSILKAKQRLHLAFSRLSLQSSSVTFITKGDLELQTLLLPPLSTLRSQARVTSTSLCRAWDGSWSLHMPGKHSAN